MTCIAGIVQNGIVYMGADSAASSGLTLRTRTDEKVFVKGEYIIGFTSSFRMGQLLRYHLIVERRSTDMDTFEFMVTKFVEAVRKCLTTGGYAHKKDDVEGAGTFLVGYNGRLFTIYSDYQVAENRSAFSAVGCGEDIALGALFSNDHLTPSERISQALEAAEQFSAGVRHPFIQRELKKEGGN